MIAIEYWAACGTQTWLWSAHGCSLRSRKLDTKILQTYLRPTWSYILVRLLNSIFTIWYATVCFCINARPIHRLCIAIVHSLKCMFYVGMRASVVIWEGVTEACAGSGGTEGGGGRENGGREGNEEHGIGACPSDFQMSAPMSSVI